MPDATPMEPDRSACKACGALALASTLAARDGACMACHRTDAGRALSQLHDALTRKLVPLVISNPFALPRNKNTSYRASVLALSRGISAAFDELGLARVSLADRHTANPDHFHVAQADLTDLGQAFIQQNFRKWLARTDRWKPESRAAEKIRQSLAKELEAFRAAPGARGANSPSR